MEFITLSHKQKRKKKTKQPQHTIDTEIKGSKRFLNKTRIGNFRNHRHANAIREALNLLEQMIPNMIRLALMLTD